MPSGNFKTNALILRLGTFAYNVLRLLGILGKDVMAYRHPAKRRRMRTIIQEMIMVPVRDDNYTCAPATTTPGRLG
jgi:hypothetical protein